MRKQCVYVAKGDVDDGYWLAPGCKPDGVEHSGDVSAWIFCPFCGLRREMPEGMETPVFLKPQAF